MIKMYKLTSRNVSFIETVELETGENVCEFWISCKISLKIMNQEKSMTLQLIPFVYG